MEVLTPGWIQILWLIRFAGFARIAYAVFRWRKFLRGVMKGWLAALGLLAAGFALFCLFAPIIGYFYPEWFDFLTILSAVGMSSLATVVGEILNFIVRRSLALSEEDQKKTIDVTSVLMRADKELEEKSALYEKSKNLHCFI